MYNQVLAVVRSTGAGIKRLYCMILSIHLRIICNKVDGCDVVSISIPNIFKTFTVPLDIFKTVRTFSDTNIAFTYKSAL